MQLPITTPAVAAMEVVAGWASRVAMEVLEATAAAPVGIAHWSAVQLPATEAVPVAVAGSSLGYGGNGGSGGGIFGGGSLTNLHARG